MQNKDFDKNLIEWIRNRRKEKQRVSRRIIQQQALKMLENEEDGFKIKVVNFI